MPTRQFPFAVHATKGNRKWFAGLAGLTRIEAEAVATTFRQIGCTTKIITVEKARQMETEPLKTITGYLSVRTNAAGKRVWAVLSHNSPLCADNESLPEVLAVAQQTFGRVVLSVWDGDVGEYTSEMLADPTY
jgi:hypothetical protein